MNMQILLVLRADLFLVEHRWRFPLLSLIAMSTKNKIGETLLMVASVFSSQNDEYNRYKNKMVDTRQNSLSFRVSNFRSLLAGCFRTSRDIRWHCCKCCGRNGVCNTWLQFPYVAPDADNSQYLMKTCGEGLTWHVSLRTLDPAESSCAGWAVDLNIAWAQMTLEGTKPRVPYLPGKVGLYALPDGQCFTLWWLCAPHYGLTMAIASMRHLFSAQANYFSTAACILTAWRCVHMVFGASCVSLPPSLDPPSCQERI